MWRLISLTIVRPLRYQTRYTVRGTIVPDDIGIKGRKSISKMSEPNHRLGREADRSAVRLFDNLY